MYRLTSGDKTKKPPLIQPPSPIGFSWNPVTRRPSVVDRAKAPGRLGGGHGGQAPFLAVQIDGGADVDVADPVAIGQAEFSIVAEDREGCVLIRPPIIVFSPVSTKVTRHGSAAALWTSMLLCLHVERDIRHVQESNSESTP